jgi:hypothetical protein
MNKPQEVIKYLEAAGGKASTTELRENLPFNESYRNSSFFGKLLGSMVKEGVLVSKLKNSSYRLASYIPPSSGKEGTWAEGMTRRALTRVKKEQ